MRMKYLIIIEILMKKKVLEYKDVEIKLDSDLKILGLDINCKSRGIFFLIGKTGSENHILKSMYSENKILDGSKFQIQILRPLVKKYSFLEEKLSYISRFPAFKRSNCI